MEKDKKAKVIFISSEGGHLSELRQLDFEKYEYKIVTEKTEVTKNIKDKYLEEDGKSKVSYLAYETRKRPFRYFFIYLFNIIKSLIIFLKFRPDIIVSTGTHTAVPMCYIARIHGKKVIWIETFANRKSKTLSGKIVYPIATTFVVQWEEMKELYPKAEYWGPIY